MTQIGKAKSRISRKGAKDAKRKIERAEPRILRMIRVEMLGTRRERWRQGEVDTGVIDPAIMGVSESV
jgi:hypothetical protein